MAAAQAAGLLLSWTGATSLLAYLIVMILVGVRLARLP